MHEDGSRSEVPERYRWDLSVLFEDDDDWQAAYERYENRVAELSFDATDAESADALLAALERRDELYLLDGRLWYYALCQSWADVTDELPKGRLRRVRQLTDRRDGAFEELEAALRQAGREHVEDLLAREPALRRYEQYLDDVFRQEQFALDPAVEAAVAELEGNLDAPSRILQAIDDRGFEPPTVTTPEGAERQLTSINYRTELAHPDREYRREVYETYREALVANKAVVTQSYLEHVRSHVARADLRGYDSALSMAVDDLVPTAIIDTLVDGVRDHDGFQRRYERLADRRAIDQLRPWDLRAPLTDAEPEIPYDEATELVVEAVEPLGAEYQTRLDGFLDDRRVDVYPAPDKLDSHPAFACGSEGTEAFVFLNYKADLESLYFFIHELGHVMHYLLARDEQPRVHQRLSWEVSELPSFLNEVLLTHYLVEETDLPNAAILDSFVRKLPLPTAARGVAFVRRVESAIRNDEDLTAADLDRFHREEQTAFLDSVSFEEGDGALWMEHSLERDPYHPYLYLLGSTCALATARRLLDGKLDAETYRALLRAGDSEYPMALLEQVDLDVGSGAVVETAGEEYERLVEQI
jgi:oligoendopeptidase F